IESFLTGSNFTKNDDLRIVMVGKTGSGKSSSGNTILGRECFDTDCSPESVTRRCSVIYSEIDGRQVAVIDTPGLFDTRNEDEVDKSLARCISFAAPGPHIFLVIVAVGRFTKEETKAVQLIQEIFGKAADRYSMVLFTHGDNLKGTIEDFISKSQGLQELVSRCNDQYHVFNNELKDKKAQVTELLQKITKIVERNGGSYYTNAMFEEAEKAIKVEKQRIQKEKEEAIENKLRLLEIERNMKELRVSMRKTDRRAAGSASSQPPRSASGNGLQGSEAPGENHPPAGAPAGPRTARPHGEATRRWGCPTEDEDVHEAPAQTEDQNLGQNCLIAV
ncbi:PREDICTED: GTPase IMAP family member 4-like, partial [Cyprinodon variegatus]|uniref:GTPase IMAP family member 4-like n=1 Tax=Cyprinodon variegatus TaxID=28743 RepID=UPI000742B867